MQCFKFVLIVFLFTSNLFAQVTDIDGFSYETTVIGSQTWMAENFKVAHFRNGDTIRELKSRKEWLEAVENEEPGWMYYKNKKNAAFGKIYNRYAVYDPRGLAPEGWHIAGEDDDWHKLIRFLLKDSTALYIGMSNENILNSLMSTEGWKYNTGTNATGFNAKPLGLINYKGRFAFFGNAIWYSAISKEYFCACNFRDHDFSCNCNKPEPNRNPENIGYYVRCVKD
jgi:uncharacterized protein (TIGR02145 family)